MSSKAETLLNNGQYRIERVLGRGEYGITYRAFDSRRQQMVAIKTVNPNLRHHAEFAQFQHHFKAVARRLGQCQHPNLVKVWEVFEDRGLPFMVMEYIPGRPLGESLSSGSQLSVTQALHYVRQIASAMTAIHQQGIIHCNLSPNGVVRDEQSDLVILTDFGIASRLTDAIAQPYLGSRNLSGGYAALEQYLPHEQLTTATDIYSLAAILYNLLAGAPPLEAPLCLSHVTETLLSSSKPSLREIRPDLSPTLERVILWGLELEQQVRPQSPDQWLAFLPELEDYAAVEPLAKEGSQSRSPSESPSASPDGEESRDYHLSKAGWSSIRGFVPLVFVMTALFSGCIGFYLTRVYGEVGLHTGVFQGSEGSFEEQFPDYDPNKPVFQQPSVEGKLMTNSISGGNGRDFDARDPDLLNGGESEERMVSEKAWVEDETDVASDWQVESIHYDTAESQGGAADGYYSESGILPADPYGSDSQADKNDRYYSESSSGGGYPGSSPSYSSEYSASDDSDSYSDRSYPMSGGTSSYEDSPPGYSSESSSESSPGYGNYPTPVESSEYYSPQPSPPSEVYNSVETDSNPTPEIPASPEAEWESRPLPSSSYGDPSWETEIEYKLPADSISVPKFETQSELPGSESTPDLAAGGAT